MLCPEENFNPTECPKIDPLDVNAYFNLMLDETNPSWIKLDTSWGCTGVDLTPAVKVAETITHLFLTPTVNPNALQFNREDYGREGVEDAGFDCITGDELSRIISMQLLKDVDQTQAIADGMVYMWNGIKNLFKPYDLKAFISETNATLAAHTSAITTLQGDVTTLKTQVAALTTRVTNLENRMTTAENNINNLLQRMTTAENNINNILSRLSAIEGAIYNWNGDKTTKIPRASINIYGDPNATGTSQSTSILSHSPSTNVIGDQRFA